MKKIVFVFIAVFTLFSFLNVNANSPHKKDTTAKPGILAKGKVVFDVYYGCPNLWAARMKKKYQPSDWYSDSWQSIGTVGLRAEYMISKSVGFGLDISYMSSWLQWTTYSSDSSYKVTLKRIGVVPRFYYHFLNHHRFDMYLSGALGYRTRQYTFSSDPAGWIGDKMAITPIALRFCLGGRVFIGNNFAFNFETGVGGALLTVGLTLKI